MLAVAASIMRLPAAMFANGKIIPAASSLRFVPERALRNSHRPNTSDLGLLPLHTRSSELGQCVFVSAAEVDPGQVFVLYERERVHRASGSISLIPKVVALLVASRPT